MVVENMAIIYQLPASPDEAQLKSVVSILEEKLPSEAPRGVQFYLGQTRNGLLGVADIKRVVRKNVPTEYRNSLHLPFASRYVDPQCRLDEPASEKFLGKYLDLAQDLGCEIVLIHTGTTYYHPLATLPEGVDPKYLWGIRSPEDLESSKREVYERLRAIAAQYPHLLVALENAPLPMNNTSGIDPKKAFLNPMVTTAKQMSDFVAYAKQNAGNLGVCLDTNHYLRMFSAMAHYESQDPEIRGMFAAMGEREDTNLPAITDLLLSDDRLFIVQLADNTGWELGKREVKAIAPSRNPYQLRRVVQLVQESEREIPISLDVDETDYEVRPNQRRTLDWILSGVDTPVSE